MEFVTANLLIGGITAAGAGMYCFWGYLQAYKATKATPEDEKFSPIKAIMTVLPSLTVGFLAGYRMDPDTAIELVSLLTAGWGFADIGAKLGINSYFDTKK